jgi:hypothetical protein
MLEKLADNDEHLMEELLSDIMPPDFMTLNSESGTG